ncbi:hypothetical protein B566_EDAN006832 [Ephemera danica]|nr:hypothetical protein B566_EDAN006832 [Ephemera danica]
MKGLELMVCNSTMQDSDSTISKSEGKQRRVKLPIRKETSAHISEFHLTKEAGPQKHNSVSLNDLAEVLKKGTPLHSAISRKVKNIQEKKKTLPKPVERIVADKESDNTYPMTLKEVLAQRRDAAKLRAQAAHLQTKAWRRNRIKSKKFHRVLRKEKVKQQIKEFEMLKETNPEEALKRLDKLERSRAQERASLRHRNTGHWAKNKAIRAKYDHECRQVLAQQLSLSRDLTQKVQPVVDSSSDSDDENEEMETDSHLSVVHEPRPEQEVSNFLSGYRKFWEQKTEADTQKSKSSAVSINLENETEASTSQMKGSKVPRKSSNTSNGHISADIKMNGQNRKKKVKQASGMWIVTELIEADSQSKQGVSAQKSSKRLRDSPVIAPNSSDTDDMKQAESLKSEKLATKKDSMRNEVRAVTSLRKKTENYASINVPLVEMPSDFVETQTSAVFTRQQIEPAKPKTLSVQDNIDPVKFLATKHIKSHQAEFVSTGMEDLDEMEDSEEAANRITIAEAFDEDDVVDNFRKEKEELEESSKPKEIDLTLPGWGEWGGSGMATSTRKRKRFILKPTVELPRKDRNKHNVILYEGKDSGIASHQVNSLPFPFTSVKDFEASIRAPIGSTWIPETAHQQLIAPRVVLPQGKIVKPMTEDVLCDSDED